MPKIERVNTLLKNEIANLVNREIFLKDGLITISYARCSADLSIAKIGVTVLPENFSGTALELLRKSSGRLRSIIGGHIRLRKMPKFIWRIDETEKKARIIDDLIDEIEKK